MLDAAHQVMIGGIAFDDHRRAGRLAVVYRQVDLVAQERGLLRRRGQSHSPGGTLLRCRRLKIARVDHNVCLHFFQIQADLVRVRVFFSYLLDSGGDDSRDHFLIQALRCLTGLLFDLLNLAHRFGDSPLQLAAFGFQFLLGFRRQLGELLRTGDLSFNEGYNAQARRRLPQRKSLLAGMGFQRRKDLGQPFFFSLLRLQSRFFVDLALKGARNFDAQTFHQFGHVLAEGSSLAGRQLDGARAVRLGKVVDVTPIERSFACRCPSLDEAFDGRGPPGAGWPQHVDVKAGTVHLQPEFEGASAARLPDDLFDVRQLVGRLKVKVSRVADPAQLLRDKFQGMGGHGVLLLAQRFA